MPDFRKVRMKLGDAEFEAEVAEDKVQAMYDQFLDAIKGSGGAAGGGRASAEKPHVGDSVDEAFLSRLFEQRPDGLIALKALPRGQQSGADAILLLLYGYRKLKGEDRVLATQLMKAARHSGSPVERIDRAVGAHEHLIITAGNRKGTTYALNNRGVAKAEEIAAHVFE